MLIWLHFKQVRRIVGALVAVAQGKLQVSDVHCMIEEPSPNKWTPVATVAPAYGLYLLNVKYDLADLSAPEQDAGEDTTTMRVFKFRQSRHVVQSHFYLIIEEKQ